MVALPMQGKLVTSTQWQGTVDRTEMRAWGGYVMTATNGWRPEIETATLTWWVTAAEAASLYASFKAGHFLGVFDYTHDTWGVMRVQLTGEYTFPEIRPGRKGEVSVGVRRA